MKARSILAGTCIVMVLLASACGKSAEQEYLDQVGDAWGLSHARFESFNETLNQSAWQNTAQLFQALTKERAGTAYDATLQAIDALEPPKGFEADHGRILEGLRTLVAIDQSIGQSLATEDLEGFVLGNSGLGEATSLLLLDLSQEVCEATRGQETSQCSHPSPIPGGDYGSSLFQIIGRFAAKFESHTRGVFIPRQSRHEDRALDILVKLQPEVVEIIEQTLAKVQLLEPPADLQQDHNRLLRYLERELDEYRDFVPVATIQPPGGGGAPEGIPFCETRDQLSEEFEPIVGFYFGDHSGICGGDQPDDSNPPPDSVAPSNR